jgi:hypothetical protein
LHADILNERHAQGELAEIVPMQQFMDSDLFLYLRPEPWDPWSLFYMHNVPRYLLEANQKEGTQQQLVRSLNLKSASELRERFTKQIQKWHEWYDDIRSIRKPIGQFEIQVIESRGTRT